MSFDYDLFVIGGGSDGLLPVHLLEEFARVAAVAQGASGADILEVLLDGCENLRRR